MEIKKPDYKSINTIPVYNFHKIIETKNYNYLFSGFDDEEDVNDSEDLAIVFDSIYNKVLEKSDNKSMHNVIKDVAQIEIYKTTINLITFIVDLILNKDSRLEDVDFYRTQLKLIYPSHNIKGDLKTEINKAIKQTKKLESRIKLLEKNIKKAKEKQEDSKEDVDIQDTAIIYQEYLGISIDIMKDSMSKWLSIGKRFKKKVEQERLNNLKNGNRGN